MCKKFFSFSNSFVKSWFSRLLCKKLQNFYRLTLNGSCDPGKWEYWEKVRSDDNDDDDDEKEEEDDNDDQDADDEDG